MDDRLNRIASMANEMAYSLKDSRSYIDGAPHIKHASLRDLYGQLVLRVFDASKQNSPLPTILDLGAGEGSVTLPFLELGAKVIAVDISQRQLDTLREKCRGYADRLEIRCGDINEILNDPNVKFDVVAVNSFLHHIPDYLTLIDRCAANLSPRGIFFSFQDPLRYDTVALPARWFTDIGYLLWRMSRGSKGDVLGGIRRRIRRRRGIYLDDCRQDNAEYHMVRNGVDQHAIKEVLEKRGFECQLISYYSTQNSVFQPIGAALGIKNTFAMLGIRNCPAATAAVSSKSCATSV